MARILVRWNPDRDCYGASRTNRTTFTAAYDEVSAAIRTLAAVLGQ